MFKALIVVPMAVVAMTSLASAQVGGSYQDSCDNIRQRGPFLSAECETLNGDTRFSSINIRGCRGGITNHNGRLTCNRDFGGGYGDDAGFRPRRGFYGFGGYPDGHDDY